MELKQAYEALNGTIREKDGCTFQSVEIVEDAPLDELSLVEAMDKKENEDMILYLGAPWCPWCRNALPVLIDVAKSTNRRITAVDMDNKRPQYQVVDGKVVKIKDGVEGYERLEQFLNDILIPYTYQDENGEHVSDIKVLSVPLVVFISNGKIQSYHYGSVELLEGQTKYDPLTKEQKIELFDIYAKNMMVDSGFGCTADGCQF